MSAAFSWIRPDPHGINIPHADLWIDPARPVGTALVTHGHADHARGGHGRTVATFGLPVFRHPPIGEEIAKLLAARAANPQRCVLVGAYALG